MDGEAHRFTRTLATTLAFALGAVVLLHVVIDPYGLFGTPSTGLTARKFFVNPYERTLKPVLAVRMKAAALVLGSSRTNVGIDPRLLDRPGKPAFNLSVNGANTRDLRALFQGAVSRISPDMAVLGLDYFSFTGLGKTDTVEIEQAFSAALLQRISLYSRFVIALKGVQDCLVSLTQNRAGTSPSHDDRGMYVGYDPDRVPFRDGGRPEAQPVLEAAYDDFATILDLAKSNGIALKLFISPYYRSHLDREDALTRWILRISEMARERGFSVLDLSAAADLTDSRDNFLDANHYRPHVGYQIVSRLLTGNVRR